jgi:hypothetical protein
MFKRQATQVINCYQKYISITLPCSCRFYPSCSEYAKQAIEKYGFWRGALIAVKRLLRCQPFSKKSGFDPLV